MYERMTLEKPSMQLSTAEKALLIGSAALIGVVVIVKIRKGAKK